MRAPVHAEHCKYGTGICESLVPEKMSGTARAEPRLRTGNIARRVSVGPTTVGHTQRKNIQKDNDETGDEDPIRLDDHF
jgi:hypothetical protein